MSRLDPADAAGASGFGSVPGRPPSSTSYRELPPSDTQPQADPAPGGPRPPQRLPLSSSSPLSGFPPTQRLPALPPAPDFSAAPALSPAPALSSSSGVGRHGRCRRCVEAVGRLVHALASQSWRPRQGRFQGSLRKCGERRKLGGVPNNLSRELPKGRNDLWDWHAGAARALEHAFPEHLWSNCYKSAIQFRPILADSGHVWPGFDKLWSILENSGPNWELAGGHVKILRPCFAENLSRDVREFFSIPPEAGVAERNLQGACEYFFAASASSLGGIVRVIKLGSTAHCSNAVVMAEQGGSLGGGGGGVGSKVAHLRLGLCRGSVPSAWRAGADRAAVAALASLPCCFGASELLCRWQSWERSSLLGGADGVRSSAWAIAG